MVPGAHAASAALLRRGLLSGVALLRPALFRGVPSGLLGEAAPPFAVRVGCSGRFGVVVLAPAAACLASRRSLAGACSLSAKA